MKFLGHIARTSGITKDLPFGTVIGKRGRGRPTTRIADNRHPDAILKVGGPKFPNGGACPMVFLGGILF